MARSKKSATTGIDLEGMNNSDLIALSVAVRKEAQRRGIEAEVEVWSSALGDEEATRIARQAAEREKERLKAEEARRIASEAAEKVREAAERAKVDEAKRKATEQAAKVRALAVRARELFGSDVAEFSVKIWVKGADKRVYIGLGFDANWVEYFHTGNGRTAPGTINTFKGVSTALGKHLGIELEAAKVIIADYCREICETWESVHVEVNTSNAPLAEGTLVTRYVLKTKGSGLYGADGSRRWFAGDVAEADRFETPELAMEAAPKYLGEHSHFLAKSIDEIEVVPTTVRVAFPPKGA